MSSAPKAETATNSNLQKTTKGHERKRCKCTACVEWRRRFNRARSRAAMSVADHWEP